MKRILQILMIPLLLVFLTTGSALAIDWNNNITIYDGKGTGDNWHGANEDQEVEPGMVGDEIWDMEGFFLEKSFLTMVGEYNHFSYPGGMAPGDVFIDVADSKGEFASLSAEYNQVGNGHQITSALGYDYVLDINYTTQQYNVIDLTSGGTTLSAFYAENAESSPWLYNSGGVAVSGYQNLSLTYATYDNATSGFSGDDVHHALDFDLSFIGNSEWFVAHYTMQCGNDNLMGLGQTAPVPEPATMLLLGTGLLGIAGLGRNKFFKK